MTTYTAPPIPIARFRDMRRAEFVFVGVDQAGPSFEGRVFLNNPHADQDTPRTPETGYAGSFHVYGYGEPAPPGIREAKSSQPEGGAPAAPIDKRLHADAAAIRAALDDADELTISVVSVPADPGGPVPQRPFERVEVVFESAATER